MAKKTSINGQKEFNEWVKIVKDEKFYSIGINF